MKIKKSELQKIIQEEILEISSPLFQGPPSSSEPSVEDRATARANDIFKRIEEKCDSRNRRNYADTLRFNPNRMGDEKAANENLDEELYANYGQDNWKAVSPQKAPSELTIHDLVMAIAMMEESLPSGSRDIWTRLRWRASGLNRVELSMGQYFERVSCVSSSPDTAHWAPHDPGTPGRARRDTSGRRKQAGQYGGGAYVPQGGREGHGTTSRYLQESDLYGIIEEELQAVLKERNKQ